MTVGVSPARHADDGYLRLVSAPTTAAPRVSSLTNRGAGRTFKAWHGLTVEIW